MPLRNAWPETRDEPLFSVATSGLARVALVADGRRESRSRLAVALGRQGYQVMVATDGAGALDAFLRIAPEVAFIDPRMTDEDGELICTQMTEIREISPRALDALVWLVDEADEPLFADQFALPGGDLLRRSFSNSDLMGRLRSVQRLRQLHAQVQELSNRERQEYALAEEVFRTAVVAGNVAHGQIQQLIRPAAHFSGDVLLSAYSPSGDLHVMLGDFTGHGLSAALGALPAAETFRAMTAKGFSVEHILRGINSKLKKMLPTGLFMAVQFVSVSRNLRHISVCNCGMPDVLILDQCGTIANAVPSANIPLGILEGLDISTGVQRIDVQPGYRVLMASDGVLDARDAAGAYFGRERFIAAVRAAAHERFALPVLAAELDCFTGDAPQDDDISLVEIPCVEEVVPGWSSDLPPAANDSLGSGQGCQESEPCGDVVEFSLTLHGARLRQADPVPLLINQLQETMPLGEHRRYLFTVFTELFVNALDHGVLGLDSALKRGDDGFMQYVKRREDALEKLRAGFVTIRVRASAENALAQVEIAVEDSGAGFDHVRQTNLIADKSQFSGRGIQLVRGLCESLSFEGAGNIVRAVYRWNADQ